jgi:hypothetical protein
LSKVSLEASLGKKRPGTWGRKDEEYIADFCLVARRTLSEEEHRLFRFHFLLGADWKLCSRKLGLDRGSFFMLSIVWSRNSDVFSGNWSLTVSFRWMNISTGRPAFWTNP